MWTGEYCHAQFECNFFFLQVVTDSVSVKCDITGKWFTRFDNISLAPEKFDAECSSINTVNYNPTKINP